METHEANRVAVGGHTAAVCRALKRLGMQSCSTRYVRYQFTPDAIRLDWYSAFWRWILALWMVRREGAEFLLEDLLSRFEALRRGHPAREDWFEMVAGCEEAHSDAVGSAIRNEDMKAVVMKLALDITRKRELLGAAQTRLAAQEAGMRGAA